MLVFCAEFFGMKSLTCVYWLYLQFLARIYREDLDELADEADFLMKNNRSTAREKVSTLGLVCHWLVQWGTNNSSSL